MVTPATVGKMRNVKELNARGVLAKEGGEYTLDPELRKAAGL